MNPPRTRIAQPAGDSNYALKSHRMGYFHWRRYRARLRALFWPFGLILEVNKMEMTPNADWQTQARGANDDEYQIYLACADNGRGGDITRNGAPLLTYDEWLAK